MGHANRQPDCYHQRKLFDKNPLIFISQYLTYAPPAQLL